MGGRKTQASPYLGTLVGVGECVMFIFHVSQTVVHVLQDLFLRREKLYDGRKEKGREGSR